MSSPATPQIGVNLGVNKIQVGDKWGVIVSVQCGTVTVNVVLPTDAARAFGREIVKWADDADKSIILPFGARPGVPDA